MTKLLQPVFVCCLLLLGVFSCGEDTPPTLSLSCTPEKAPNEAVLAAALVGEWEWKANGNCGSSENYSETAEKGVSIRFSEDGTFEEVKSNTVVVEGTWQLENRGENSFYIQTEPYHRLLAGEVLYCGNELMFYLSPVDGCDQLFVRSNTSTED